MKASQSPGFESSTGTADLKRRSVQGAAATGTGQVVKFAIRLSATAVLARLLTPQDYGLVAMTTVVTGFASVFKDAGLTSATIQRESITHEQVSALFWINVALGCLIASLLAAAAPGIATFYGEPRLAGIVWWLAITFVLGGFTVQHQALLRRRMQFGTLALLETTSLLAGLSVAVFMAWTGLGYWSLVGLAVGTSAANAAGVWLACPWRPGSTSRGSGAGPLLRFGGDLLAFNIANFFSRQADSLLIGRYWGATTLGLYDRAYTLLMLPIGQMNTPLAAVAIPALSRSRAIEPQLRRLFLGALQMVASLTVPTVAVMVIFADELVVLWLGAGWSGVAELFRLLALAAALGAMSNPVGWLMVAMGHTRKYRQLGLANALVTVGAFVMGLPYGARGVAIAYSISSCVTLLPIWWYGLRDTPVSLGSVARCLAPPVVSCLPAALIAGIVARAPLEIPFNVAAGLVSFGSVYAVTLLIGFGRWAFFRRIVEDLKAMAGNS